jgi:hypothetical protein
MEPAEGSFFTREAPALLKSFGVNECGHRPRAASLRRLRAGGSILMGQGLSAWKNDDARRHYVCASVARGSSVYLSAEPRALSTGYFALFEASFSRIASTASAPIACANRSA